jgi:hypothetical protein
MRLWTVVSLRAINSANSPNLAHCFSCSAVSLSPDSFAPANLESRGVFPATGFTQSASAFVVSAQTPPDCLFGRRSLKRMLSFAYSRAMALLAVDTAPLDALSARSGRALSGSSSRFEPRSLTPSQLRPWTNGRGRRYLNEGSSATRLSHDGDQNLRTKVDALDIHVEYPVKLLFGHVKSRLV